MDLNFAPAYLRLLFASSGRLFTFSVYTGQTACTRALYSFSPAPPSREHMELPNSDPGRDSRGSSRTKKEVCESSVKSENHLMQRSLKDLDRFNSINWR